jgi:hypothetical protein
MPAALVNSEPSSAGGNSAMCAAEASATTFGNGNVLRDLGDLVEPGASRLA